MAKKATSGITNLFLYNTFINDVNDDPTSHISDTGTLRYIIDQTNDLIEKWCARSFETATYKEWVDGAGTPFLVLNNYPITSVKLVSTSSIDLFTVENNANNPFATVSSNNASMVLTSINTAGSETTTIIEYADQANVNSIVTAIDLVSGWDAEVLSDRGDSLTQLIRPLDSGWAEGELVYMQGPYLGNNIRISYDSDAVLESVHGCSFCGDVFVWYTAGYVLPVCDDAGGELTTVGNVPEGLTLIANEIIKDVSEQKNEDTNMNKESIGDYTYERNSIISAVDRRSDDLNLYSRKSI